MSLIDSVVIAPGWDELVGGGVPMVVVDAGAAIVVAGEEIVTRKIIGNATSFFQRCHFSD